MNAVFPPPVPVDDLPTPQPDVPSTPGARLAAIIVAVLVVLAAAVGAIVLLGGAGEDAEASYAFASAVEQASEARTVTFDMTMSVGALGEVSMHGAADHEAELMTMSIDVGSMLGSLDMGGALGAEAGSIEMILDVRDGTMYMSAGALAGLLPIDAEWLSADLAELAEMSGQSLDDLRGEFSYDPSRSIAVLLDAYDATEVGLEDIDGETMMHYRVQVSLADVLAANPEIQEQLDAAGVDPSTIDAAPLPESVTYDVWVGADDQLRRVVFDLPAAGETLHAQLDLRSSDEPLAVSIPAGDEVVDITALMGL